MTSFRRFAMLSKIIASGQDKVRSKPGSYGNTSRLRLSGNLTSSVPYPPARLQLRTALEALVTTPYTFQFPLYIHHTHNQPTSIQTLTDLEVADVEERVFLPKCKYMLLLSFSISKYTDIVIYYCMGLGSFLSFFFCTCEITAVAHLFTRSQWQLLMN